MKTQNHIAGRWCDAAAGDCSGAPEAAAQPLSSSEATAIAVRSAVLLRVVRAMGAIRSV